MKEQIPRVSIGLPVYNGDNYLEQALDSLLAQTYTDFELIITDNASTDRTEAICRAYAARDTRIRYVRNAENLGATRNFNYAFELARGEYFKWAAHDDLYDPAFVERCVEVLDSDPSMVLCYARTRAIDEQSRPLFVFPANLRVDSPRASVRFLEAVTNYDPQVIVFGLIRSDVLRKTILIGNFAAADKVLIGELALRGRFHELPEVLFSYRNHVQQSWQAYPSHTYDGWFDPRKIGKKSFPRWRLLYEHIGAIGRAAQGWHERMLCYIFMGRWIRLEWKRLLSNLMPIAGR
jgi:glycosyltransferase involved in cell wall biosynthesis